MQKCKEVLKDINTLKMAGIMGTHVQKNMCCTPFKAMCLFIILLTVYFSIELTNQIERKKVESFNKLFPVK